MVCIALTGTAFAASVDTQLVTQTDADQLNNVIHPPQPAAQVVPPAAQPAANKQDIKQDIVVRKVTHKTITKKVRTKTGKVHYRQVHATYVTTYHYGRGTGDCWTNSANLYGQLTSAGQRARIIQYATSLSPRHRSVQVYTNGAWTNYNYKANGYAQTYYATSNSVNGKVV